MASCPISNHQKESAIEQLLAINRISEDDEEDGIDTFTHALPLKCPPWARGAYGGHTLAIALLAAYATVPVNHQAHSIHCDFLHAANVSSQVLFVVHRTRDSKSFASRMIEAKQGSKVIFIATANFTTSKHIQRREFLHHATPFPELGRLSSPPPDNVDKTFATQSAAGQGGFNQPCDCVRVVRKGATQSFHDPSARKFYQWIRARGKIIGGIQQQLAALAYMTDNYFLGTIFRAHNATRFSGRSPSTPAFGSGDTERQELQSYYEALKKEELLDNVELWSSSSSHNGKQVDWLVTLDHSIYFHNVDKVCADEWMLAEMESPWAGSERGLVMERIWSSSGALLATCVQQGVIRLQSDHGQGKL